MAKKKGWWSQPAFSSSKSRHTKPASSKPAPKEKIEKCSGCRKPLLRCSCKDVRTFVAPPKPKRGEPKPEKTNTQVDTNGVEWCNICSSRAWKNVCMDVTCSSRE